mmetsp:Transcript_7171/g.18397  ORF Transcript_7171/g.18397 Transcript_7171/m.18397 type:complete len:268 (+) Transcript_7171:1145-1948(+)
MDLGDIVSARQCCSHSFLAARTYHRRVSMAGRCIFASQRLAEVWMKMAHVDFVQLALRPTDARQFCVVQPPTEHDLFCLHAKLDRLVHACQGGAQVAKLGEAAPKGEILTPQIYTHLWVNVAEANFLELTPWAALSVADLIVQPPPTRHFGGVRIRIGVHRLQECHFRQLQRRLDGQVRLAPVLRIVCLHKLTVHVCASISQQRCTGERKHLGTRATARLKEGGIIVARDSFAARLPVSARGGHGCCQSRVCLPASAASNKRTMSFR